jgi:hypothetical protein
MEVPGARQKESYLAAEVAQGASISSHAPSGATPRVDASTRVHGSDSHELVADHKGDHVGDSGESVCVLCLGALQLEEGIIHKQPGDVYKLLEHQSLSSAIDPKAFSPLRRTSVVEVMQLIQESGHSIDEFGLQVQVCCVFRVPVLASCRCDACTC